MRFNTWAFIVLLCVTGFLIIGFKHISHAAFTTTINSRHQTPKQTPATKIREISLPEGYMRIGVKEGSFGEWLRNFPLRKNNTVYLYNGQPVDEQSLHYAVLDISTGNKDLQQCADAIMRLRAEYFFAKKDYGKIEFGEGKEKMSFLNILRNADVTEEMVRPLFMQYLEKVFINCGTYTVDAMSTPIPLDSMQPGDMFVKAGSPGHAMVVVDVATNLTGKKIYMLAQSYMPAQDMHIVINPMDANLSPWYEVAANKQVITPGWVFTPGQLKRWK